jgi:hypothetical protein
MILKEVHAIGRVVFDREMTNNNNKQDILAKMRVLESKSRGIFTYYTIMTLTTTTEKRSLFFNSSASIISQMASNASKVSSRDTL